MAARTMTFVFTDIEGSTRRWEADEAATREALELHDRLLRDEIEAAAGTVFKHTGDGSCAVFDNATAAVGAAINAQRRLTAGEAAGLRVRIAVYTGSADDRDDDWFGPALNRCARVLGAIHGGQVVVGASTASLVREHAELVDLGEHTLRDIAQPERLWQVTAEGLERDFPPLSTATKRGNLPAVRTSFVGRTTDVEDLLARIPVARLTTLTGIGGSGKTRLATVVAEAASNDYEDGAWFVDLAPVADESLVSSAFASALAIPGAGEPRRDVLLYLERKHLLLVVDNCEHVLDAIGELIDELLAHAAGITVLATSREPLGVEGEQIWRVPSLDAEGGSLQLFEDRARSVRAEFVVDATDRATVLAICRQLDGIPLAIELAAAQISAFTPSQIAEMLDERFTLLTGGRRRGRQATLAATMDWSYRLLAEPEKAALRHASVLSGTFSIEAFAAVDDDSSAEAAQVLRALVAKSLVEPGADGRYRMLETVRLYGEDRLADADEAPHTRDRLLRWVRTTLAPLGDSERAQFVTDEIETIRAAIAWAGATVGPSGPAGLVPLVGDGLLRAMLLDDLGRLLDAAEACDAELPIDEQVHWRALRGGSLAIAGGDLGGLDWVRAAIDMDPELTTIGGALALLFEALYLCLADPPAARIAIDRGLARPGLPPLVAENFVVTDGMLELDVGNYALAADKLLAASVHAQAAGAHWPANTALIGRATALDLMGEHEQARRLGIELVENGGATTQWVNELIVLQAIAVPTARLGDLDEARSVVRRMLAVARDRFAHIRNAIGPVVVGAGVVLSYAGEREAALEVLAGAQATLIAARSDMAWTTARHDIARLREELGPDAIAPLRRGRALGIDELVSIAEAAVAAPRS